MHAKMPINLYESLSNLKSIGGGYNIAAIKAPLLVVKPVLITLARTGRSPRHLRTIYHLVSSIRYKNIRYKKLYSCIYTCTVKRKELYVP